jgi:hypothetical protein
VADLPRRKFLKTIGSAAVVAAVPDLVFSAQRPKRAVAVFWEPEFPSFEGCYLTLERLQAALQRPFNVSVLNENDLIEQLSVARFHLLVTPYGSAFPKRAWPAILKYLREGGSWLNIGGVPLSRPVVRTGSVWVAEAKQATYHKRLGITHSFRVDPAAMAILPASMMSYKTEREGGSPPDETYELYVRLSSSNNETDEAGSDGPHEGVVEPLLWVLNRDGRMVAAPVIQIDRLLGEFAGGRWVLVNASWKIDDSVVSEMAQRAAGAASRFEVRSDFASYKRGEIPTLTVELLRPKGDLLKLATKMEGSIDVRDETDAIVSHLNLTIDVESNKAAGTVKLSDAANFKPGIYKIEAIIASLLLKHTNGFWIYDEALLSRGKPLTVDKHFFYRDGEVFPVTGTTYMASDKHRRFLFEPNPFVWDTDFHNMKKAGVNMVRTGIWTGWKKYMPEPGKVNEATLRAFDAFLLTAHKHDIPIILNFFAFLPETWGGENAYLDPRSVKAQQQFVSAFTERCRRVDDVMWDFINEPSFCSPKYLWNCRPNYDAHEKAAWKQWLKDRYPAASDEEHVSKLQELWRTSGDDTLELPRLQDFESVHLIDDRLPLKTLDYRLFAQDMFIRWVRQMTPAIRSNGNTKQLITVGQDEGGLGDSPNMQLFAKEIDFVSLHNWWNNDDLLWDSVLAKTPSKLSLMEETGVMFYEKSDGGEPWRSEEEASHLLERKMALSFAADGAGFVEWIFVTNPYMNSTNEVGIGFHRVDRTMKPEFEPFLRIAKFMAQYGKYLKDRVAEPVAMVIPHSQMFAPRSFAQEATRRCVRAMYYHCGMPMQAISEYTVSEYTGQAKLIVVPSPRVLTQKSWQWLMAEKERGTTVAISGPIDLDEHWRPTRTLFAYDAKSEPVAESELIRIGERDYVIRYDGEKMQRIEKAVIAPPVKSERPVSFVSGRGVIWSMLPLELGDSMPALAAFYDLALSNAHVSPVFSATPRTPAVLILPSVFRDVVLYTFVSEASRDMDMRMTHLESRTPFTVSVPAQRTAMVLLERKTGKIIGRM